MEKVKILFAGNYNLKNSNILALADDTERLAIGGIFETPERIITEYDSLNPHIIFVDAYLGNLTGFEVARFIKEQDRLIKVIVVSEKFSLDFLNLCMEMSLDGYLPKNSSPSLIKDVIDTILSNSPSFDVILEDLLKNPRHN